MNKILLIALLIGATFSQNLNNDMIKTEINANDLPLLIPTETASVEIIQVDPIQVYLPPAPQDKASTDEQYIGTANIEILPGKEAYPETGQFLPPTPPTPPPIESSPPVRSKFEQKQDEILEQHSMRVEEETKRFEMKILEIESEFTDPEERASKIEKANRKHEKHLKRIQEKLEEKLEELQEDFQNGDLQEEEEGDFQEQKNGQSHQKKLKNSQYFDSKGFKKLGQKLLVFFFVSIFLACVVRRIKMKRERRRLRRQQWAAQQQQQQQQSQQQQQQFQPQYPAVAPLQGRGHIQNPFTRQQQQQQQQHPIYPQAPLSVPQYVPYNPNVNNDRKINNNQERVIHVEQQKVEAPKREEVQIQMKKVEKETQAFREVPLPQEVNGEEQIHYLPVKILPNGQMVVLAPLNQGLPEVSQQAAARANKYPDLDNNVIVGAPVYQTNYNYPMKSQ